MRAEVSRGWGVGIRVLVSRVQGLGLGVLVVVVGVHCAI